MGQMRGSFRCNSRKAKKGDEMNAGIFLIFYYLLYFAAIIYLIVSENKKKKRYFSKRQTNTQVAVHDEAHAAEIARAKNRERKALIMCFSIPLALMLLFGISCYSCVNVKSCSFNSYWKSEFVFGDFVCQEKGDNILIAGFSEQGKMKNTIVIPERIRSRKVIAVNDRANRNRAKLFASANLETLYYSDLKFNESFDSFPNLKRIFAGNPNCVIGLVSSEVDIYICEEFYEFYRNQEDESFPSLKRANVMYSMNVSGRADDVLWVSEERYGGLIVNMIPENPYLEGYAFAGWFKDSRCTKPWNFEKDCVPVSAFADEFTPYHQLVLYAKWVKA